MLCAHIITQGSIQFRKAKLLVEQKHIDFLINCFRKERAQQEPDRCISSFSIQCLLAARRIARHTHSWIPRLCGNGLQVFDFRVQKTCLLMPKGIRNGNQKSSFTWHSHLSVYHFTLRRIFFTVPSKRFFS